MPVKRQGLTVTIESGHILTGQTVVVPGDISSAAFLLVAALILPGSDITIRKVGINPTRSGIIDALLAMGADLEIRPAATGAEPMADIRVRYSKLRGIELAGRLSLIDEIPILAIAAAFATGETVIRDAAELKVKESNRIAVVVGGLTAMVANAEEQEDGLIIRGGSSLTGTVLDSRGDHRTANRDSRTPLSTTGNTTITNGDCIAVPFPALLRCCAS